MPKPRNCEEELISHVNHLRTNYVRVTSPDPYEKVEDALRKI